MPFALPADLDHNPDLSALSPGERLKFLRQAMVAAFHNGGWPAVRALRERYPAAAGLSLKVDAFAFQPKPKGYYDAVGKMVGTWLTDSAATQGSNRQDVAALSAELGGPPRPGNELSKAMNKTTRDRCRAVFAAKGLTLPETAKTLSQVKAAARAARAIAQPEATPFGTIGAITGDTLAISGATFRIDRHGHDYIRLTVNGQRQRLRLDALQEFLRQAGLLDFQPGDTPFTTYGRGNIGPKAEMAANEGEAAEPVRETWPAAVTSPDTLPGTLAHDPAPTLSERITRLAAAACPPQANTLLPDIDPLEFTGSDAAP